MAGSRLESSAGSDKGSEGNHEPSSSHSQHSRLLGGTGEVEKLRTALRQKEDQITSLQSQLNNLEATRDRSAVGLAHTRGMLLHISGTNGDHVLRDGCDDVAVWL